MRRPPNFRAGVCSEPETVGNVHHGGAQSLRRPTVFVKGGRTEPEPVGNFQHGGCTARAASHRFREEGRAAPEAVGNFDHGGAQSLRRPTILVSGVHKKCSGPKTVGNFIMGVQRASWYDGMQECMSPAYNLYIRCTGCYAGQKHLHHDFMKV